tara:strand:+ start:95 stop:1339 length:1245 start_codon:yes stop_codon:yes gene_type:complete
LATVRPFKAIRPVRDKVHLVASRSYITYKHEDLKRKLDENPYTFLHILNPEYKSLERTKPNTKARFEKIKEKFSDFLIDGHLKEDEKQNFYLYRQIKDGHPSLGIIGCASVEDYYNKTIKIHEATISRREEIFKEYLKTVEINAEPVCFTYPNQPEIDQLCSKISQETPEYDFSTTNKVRHTFWLIDKEADIKAIEKAFEKVSSIYIADGHHRSASSALLGRELKEANKNHTGDEGYNYFMGIFIPENELKIFEFNRLVSDLGDLSSADFLERIRDNFEVINTEQEVFVPRKVHEIGLYLDKRWYCLIPREEKIDTTDPISSLDVSILSDLLLEPILGIDDLRTDPRISFCGGPTALKESKKLVDSGKARLAFVHYPVSMQQLKTIADNDLIMPPKSTWIEPKLRSGLTVYSFK